MDSIGGGGDSAGPQKTEIIDSFLQILKEDLLHWTTAAEQVTPEGVQRVYTKEVVEGRSIEASECYVRVACLVRDVSPEYLFDLFYDSSKRVAWDDRMSHVETVESTDTASNEFI